MISDQMIALVIDNGGHGLEDTSGRVGVATVT